MDLSAIGAATQMNANKLAQYQEFHPLNFNAISQLKQILHTFRHKMLDIAFLSTDVGPTSIPASHPMHTKMAQHLQIEKLYVAYHREYHHKKQVEANSLFVETIDTEEIESLRHNVQLYHDSVMNNTVALVQHMERDPELKRAILVCMSAPHLEHPLSAKWRDVVDRVNVFEAIESYALSYNWAFQQLESRKLFRLQTMVAKERRTLSFLAAKQQTERRQRQYRLHTLYERLAALQSKMQRLKSTTRRRRETEHKWHGAWIADNMATWTAQRQQVERRTSRLGAEFETGKEADRATEKTQLRRTIKKEMELARLQSAYRQRVEAKYQRYATLKAEVRAKRDKLCGVQDLFAGIEARQHKEAVARQKSKLRCLWYCSAMLGVKLHKARRRVRAEHEMKAKKGNKKKKKKKGKGKKGKKGKKDKKNVKTKKKKKN